MTFSRLGVEGSSVLEQLSQQDEGSNPSLLRRSRETSASEATCCAAPGDSMLGDIATRGSAGRTS